MASVFVKDDKYIQKQPRNSYDLSSQNNLTTNFGKLVPVFCQEVLPGDSFRIKPTFGLRFLPQVFPVQTRMRAHIHYFYVRNRTLWKDWMDFIGKTKSGLTPPYLSVNSSDLYPSSLHDYLGLPVWLHGESGLVWTALPTRYTDKVVNVASGTLEDRDKRFTKLLKFTGSKSLNSVYGVVGEDAPESGLDNFISNPAVYWYSQPVRVPRLLEDGNFNTHFHVKYYSNLGVPIYLICRMQSGDIVALHYNTTTQMNERDLLNNVVYDFTAEDGTVTSKRGMISEVLGYMCENAVSYEVNGELTITDVYMYFATQIELSEYSGLPLSFIDSADIPYYSYANPNGERISALPFRAYEAIYNFFYRNAEVTPFMVDGQPEYNRYITNYDGGADYVDYHLFNRPWADDRFTTCRVSPQAGEAPLVGLTGVNGATVTLAADDGTISIVHLQVDSDTGNVVMVDDVKSDNADELKSTFMSAVDYGITISDLRNVNSFQKWMENKNRRGFKYADQMSGHYGIKIRYDVLQAPEFIGGVSRDVVVNQISQTVETETGNLGDIAGQAGVVGSSETIENFCDEHGFIIGIMSVVPAPMYSQAIPKHLLKSDAFDYFFPEFGKIGYQPILNKELSFLQSKFSGNDGEVFGYQRAWSDYLENLDAVHGLFLSDFKNFLLGRVFSETPKLSGDFLYVDNNQLNNIFYVDDDSDKILGQIYHDVKAKRQIPLLGIPSLD